MCRLYGFRANEPTRVECTLVHARNALLIQSRSDLRGKSHPDGWGIGYYENGRPALERRDGAAYQDVYFHATAERVYTTSVVAHVRKATVGGASLVNTHPFSHGRWVFVHNGTVTGFEEAGPRLARETDPDLLEHRRGGTDSELLFYWLLTRMRRSGIDLDGADDDASPLATVLGDAIRHVDGLCAELSDKPARLNLLLTDGRRLVASRWRNDLHWVERQGLQDCEICGTPHIHHEPDRDYRAVAVASEPISHEDWAQLEDGDILAVNSDVTARVHSV